MFSTIPGDEKYFYFDFHYLPVRSEVMLSLPLLINRLEPVGSMMLIHFGASFPWTVGSRIQDVRVYPEQVLGGLRSETKRKGVRLVPVLPAPDKMCFLKRWGDYNHLFDPSTYLFNPLAVGAKKLMEDLLDDTLSLLESDTVAFDLRPYQDHQIWNSEFVTAFFIPLVKYLQENGKSILFLYRKDAGEMVDFDRLKNEKGCIFYALEQVSFHNPEIPYPEYQLESVYDRLKRKGDILGRDEDYAYRSRKSLVMNLIQLLQRCWKMIIQVKQNKAYYYLAQLPASYCSLIRDWKSLQQSMKELYDIIKEMEQAFKTAIDSDILNSWLRSRFNPLLEEYLQLLSKIGNLFPEEEDTVTRLLISGRRD